LVTPETSHIPESGAGLYLAREITGLHGGDISVELQTGGGSTFTLTVPLGAASERVRPSVAAGGVADRRPARLVSR
jgi:signal transduction histidine kinase